MPPGGIRTIRDMNADGVPEIILAGVEIIGTHLNHTRAFRILQWDGEAFVDLIQSEDGSFRARVNNGDGNIVDTDGDGVLELVLTHGPGRDATGELSEPERVDIWAWDGGHFVLTASE